MMGRASFARAAALAFASSSVLATGTAGAASLTLLNDGFQDGASIGLQSGFLAGEAAAVTLGPVDVPFSIEKVQLVFGPAAGNETVTLRLYLDDGGEDPGTMLYEADYELQSADDAIIEIDLAAESIQVASGSIRVALLFQHSGLPSVARDDDGSIQPGRNWIFADGAWTDSADFGVPGDWIIRAEVETEDDPGPSTTAASSTGAQASSSASTGAGTTTGAGPASSGAGVTSGGQVCTPGETQACFGDGACPGGQSCLPDGTGWDTCTCGQSGGDGGGSADTATEGGQDDGCGCSVPGAGRAPWAAGALAAAAVAALGVRRRRARAVSAPPRR